MLCQNIVCLFCIRSIFCFQFSSRRNCPLTSGDFRNNRINQLGYMRGYTCIIDRCFLIRTTQSCIICEIIIDHKFMNRCCIIGNLVDVADSMISLLDVRVFCNDNGGIRVVDTNTLIIQIRTNSGLWCNYRYFCRRRN